MEAAFLLVLFNTVCVNRYVTATTPTKSAALLSSTSTLLALYHPAFQPGWRQVTT